MPNISNFQLAQSSFKIESVPPTTDDFIVSYITVPQFPELQITGFAITLDVTKFSLQVFPFYDLINKSFKVADNNMLASTNLGVTLPEFLMKLPEHESSEHYPSRTLRFACNTIHTNFVRGNGFIISSDQMDGHDLKIIKKPPEAVALDGTHFYALESYDQKYTALALLPRPQLIDVKITSAHRVGFEIFDAHTGDVLENVELAISGPAIVKAEKNVVQEIKVREKHDGQTIGNEINYIPSIPYQDSNDIQVITLPQNKQILRSSFTAFGIERRTGYLIIVSVFSGSVKNNGDEVDLFVPHRNQTQGITLYEMGELMKVLGASDAIIGGGSGDTQQYIRERGIRNDTWIAQSRYQKDRPQIDDIRGLGAILTIHDL